MRITNEDLILYSIYELISRENKKIKVSHDDLASNLNIKPSSLRVYISNMAGKGLIEMRIKHHEENLLELIDITDQGFGSIEQVREVLSNSFFTPENHGIETVWRFFDIYDQYTNPLERISILTMFVKKKKFNVSAFLGVLETMKDENTFSRIFHDHFVSGKRKEETFGKAVLRMSLSGIDKDDQIFKKNTDNDNIDTLILIAESSRRRGELEFAYRQFRQLLTPRFELDEYQWFQVQLNLISLDIERGNESQAREQMEYLGSQTNDQVLRAYLRELEGLIYYFNKDFEMALARLTSSIKAFHRLNDEFFLNIAYSNRGVVYFNMEKIKSAEKDWNKALNYARNIKSKYCEANIYPNLADVEIHKKNYDRARRMLDRAERMFMELGCIRGRDAVEFNRALLFLEMKDLNQAIEHFHASETISPSFPTMKEKIIRKEWFLKRAEELGFTEIHSLFK